MGWLKKLLEPSNQDQEHEKKPRFLQDFLVVIIFGVGVLAWIIYELVR